MTESMNAQAQAAEVAEMAAAVAETVAAGAAAGVMAAGAAAAEVVKAAVAEAAEGADAGLGVGTGAREVAIIGYGTAGVNAAIALRNAGYTGVIRAFSDTDILPYSPILTSYYVGGEKTYEQCFPWNEEELAELDVTLMASCPVTGLDPDARVISTPQGDFAYEKCVIATGARPVLVGFPQVEGYEPLVLRTMADAERFKAAVSADECQRVLVSGASMIALKSLEACLNCGCSVELVGMNTHVLDMSALPVAAERFERGLREKGVALRLGQTIAGVRVLDAAEAAERGGKLEVTFSNGDVACFDEIVVAHGVRSDLGFVKAGSLEIDRALVVDEFMRTSNPHVYAAGDVAQALELISGEKRVLGIWKTAALQGQCAGAAIAAEMAGEEPSAAAAYRGAISANTIAVQGTLFVSAGSVDVCEGRAVEVRETDDMTVVCVFEELAGEAGEGACGSAGACGVEDACGAADGRGIAGARRLVGYNVACDHDEPGSVAYDTAAMLTLRIEAAFRRV